MDSLRGDRERVLEFVQAQTAWEDAVKNNELFASHWAQIAELYRMAHLSFIQSDSNPEGMSMDSASLRNMLLLGAVTLYRGYETDRFNFYGYLSGLRYLAQLFGVGVLAVPSYPTGNEIVGQYTNGMKIPSQDALSHIPVPQSDFPSRLDEISYLFERQGYPPSPMTNYIDKTNLVLAGLTDFSSLLPGLALHGDLLKSLRRLGAQPGRLRIFFSSPAHNTETAGHTFRETIEKIERHMSQTLGRSARIEEFFDAIVINDFSQHTDEEKRWYTPERGFYNGAVIPTPSDLAWLKHKGLRVVSDVNFVDVKVIPGGARDGSDSVQIIGVADKVAQIISRIYSEDRKSSQKSVGSALLAATVEGLGSMTGVLSALGALLALATGADLSPVVHMVLGATAVVGTWFTFFLAGPRALFHWNQSRLLRLAEGMGQGGASRAPPSAEAALRGLMQGPLLKDLLAGVQVVFTSLPSGVAAQAVGANQIQLDVRAMTGPGMSLDQQISIVHHEVGHLRFRAAHPTLTRLLGEGSWLEEVVVSWSDRRATVTGDVLARIQSLEGRLAVQEVPSVRFQSQPTRSSVGQAGSALIPLPIATPGLLENLNLGSLSIESLDPSLSRAQSLARLSVLLSGDNVNPALLEGFDRSMGSGRLDAATRAFAALAEDTLLVAAIQQAAQLAPQWAELSVEGRQAALGQLVQKDLMPLLAELRALAGLAGYTVTDVDGERGFSSAFVEASLQIYTDRVIQALANTPQANTGTGADVGFVDFVSMSAGDPLAQKTAQALGEWLDRVPNVKGKTRPTLEIFVEDGAILKKEKLKESLLALLALEPGSAPARVAALDRVNLHLLTVADMPAPVNGRYPLSEVVEFIARRDLDGKLPARFQAYTTRPNIFQLSWRYRVLIQLLNILDGDVVPVTIDVELYEAIKRYA